jgi:glycosyltransferase involved in cell wall biosynthesis
MALDSELRMRKMQFLAGGIITISTYLEKYYSSYSLPTLSIPPLIDALSEKWSNRLTFSNEKGVNLAFVGNAGKKDLVVNAIRGLALLGKDAGRCRITMVGPSRQEVQKNLGRDADLLQQFNISLYFAGRLSHREALRYLSQADYSILLRPDARFAHAGFPTKLVESCAMGVPVICNCTGDLGLYVRDNCEGIVVKNCSPEAFAEGVRRALGMTKSDRELMGKYARKRAELSFDFRSWTKPLDQFLNMVIDRKRKTTDYEGRLRRKGKVSII